MRIQDVYENQWVGNHLYVSQILHRRFWQISPKPKMMTRFENTLLHYLMLFSFCVLIQSFGKSEDPRHPADHLLGRL